MLITYRNYDIVNNQICVAIDTVTYCRYSFMISEKHQTLSWQTDNQAASIEVEGYVTEMS